MPDYMKELSASQQALINNPRNRVIVCFCVDTSFSMNLPCSDGISKIKHVNDGIEGFIRQTAADPYAKDAVDLCIISFGNGGTKTVVPFSSTTDIISRHKFTPMKADGDTPLGEAIVTSLQAIKNRKREYENRGISCYKPWLIVMSDGEANDDITIGASVLRKEIEKKRLKIECIDMGEEKDNARKSLARLSPNGEVDTIDALAITDFFSKLSKSTSFLSTNVLQEDGNIPINEFTRKSNEFH